MKYLTLVFTALTLVSCAPAIPEAVVVPERVPPASDNRLWEYPDWR